jgi:3-hydroxyacyl-CoA dehydrogenase
MSRGAYRRCLAHMQALHQADYVVEAVPEDEILKRSVFHALDRVSV